MPAKVKGPTTKAAIRKALGERAAKQFLSGRKVTGYTRSAIAAKLGVSLATLYRMLSGAGPYASL